MDGDATNEMLGDVLEVNRAVRSTKRQEGGPVTPLLSPEVMARATAQTRFGDPADRPEGEQNRAAVQGSGYSMRKNIITYLDTFCE